MSQKISKTEAKEKIENFFNNLENKTAKEVKKIKKLAMKNNVQLKEKRKFFCKKCFSPYKNPKVRIRKGVKSITCENCGNINQWKIR